MRGGQRWGAGFPYDSEVETGYCDYGYQDAVHGRPGVKQTDKKEFPWIEIIILTGYEEFEYAKEGIKIGIAQYLSKPINGEELLKEVDAIAIRIEEKRKEREIKEKYMKEMEENLHKERKELFQYLVTGSKSVAELWRRQTGWTLTFLLCGIISC